MLTQPAATATCIGRIASIDVPNRTVKIRGSAVDSVEMIVVPDCSIFLHGEAVRLRLLLAGDEVEVCFVQNDNLPRAIKISVLTRSGR